MTTVSAFALLRNYNIRLLLAFLFVYGLLLQYGKTHFYRDPGSIFYDEKRGFSRHYSDYRQVEAEEFIERQIISVDEVSLPNKVGENPTKAGENPTICANFATLKRKGEQYIGGSIASALAGLTPKERKDLHLSVFFANTDPNEHPLYNEPWLRTVVDSVYTHSREDEVEFAHIQDLEYTRNFSAKGVLDYTYGLAHCYDVGAPYVLMFEDDVLIADGWFAKTKNSLDEISTKTDRRDWEWLYMRLFNQERSTGWGSNRIGANNEHWISLGVNFAILSVAGMLKKRRTQATKSFPDVWSLSIVCLLVTPSLVILFFQSGKASMLPPKPGVFAQGYGCCSQALLFPREQIPALIEFLREEDHGQVDLLINIHARQQALTRLSMYPVQVQHVGTQSVRGTDKDEAKAIWSMAFEDKNPEILKQEHTDLVNLVYPESNGVPRRSRVKPLSSS